MNQELEIEYKQLLTSYEFAMLLNVFHIGDRDFIKQENTYFDTFSFDLKAARSALRIRHRLEQFVLTLKQTAEVGMIETHQSLTSEEIANLEHHGQLPTGAITTRLNQLGIENIMLQRLGTLTTYRAECSYRKGMLIFDHSLYLGLEDFELEYEVQNPELGKRVFLQLLHDHHIVSTPTKNKIARFFDRKLEIGGS